MNKIKGYKYWILGVLIILIVSILFIKNKNSNSSDLYTIVKGDISESIEVAGKVKPSSESNLNFEKSGVISSINVKVGQKVNKGQTLASLSSSDLMAQVEQAQAALDSANANLNSIVQGARPEEIAVKEQALASARSDFDLQNSQVADTFNSVSNTLNDILYFKLSYLFSQNGDTFKYTVNNCDQTAASNIETQYRKDLNTFKALTLSTDNNANLSSLGALASDIRQLINTISTAVTASCVIGDNSIADKRTYVSAAKTSIVAAITEINVKKTALNASRNAIDRAQKDLTLISAGGDKNKIDIQKAVVAQAQAGLSNAQAQLSKNILRAPFDGIVTAVDIDQGELAITNKSAISIMSENSFELEVNLSEIDAAKIVDGQPVDITLDAFGNDTHWPGTVTRVDPSATNNNGISNYKAIISFVKPTSTSNSNMDKIKSGMTANAKIIINRKTDIVTIPNKYLKTANGKTTVSIKSGNTYVDKEIELGIRGDEGNVEVTSGLSAGDVIKVVSK